VEFPHTRIFRGAADQFAGERPLRFPLRFRQKSSFEFSQVIGRFCSRHFESEFFIYFRSTAHQKGRIGATSATPARFGHLSRRCFGRPLSPKHVLSSAFSSVWAPHCGALSQPEEASKQQMQQRQSAGRSSICASVSGWNTFSVQKGLSERQCQLSRSKNQFIKNRPFFPDAFVKNRP
jgi:hypothetical protein